MQIVRLYSDEGGQSHFEDLEPHMPVDGAAALLEASGVVGIRRHGPGGQAAWHNAPRRQYVVMLEGKMEVEASDGTSRRFGPGDVLLVEDVTGVGHVTRTLGTAQRVLLDIPVVTDA